MDCRYQAISLIEDRLAQGSMSVIAILHQPIVPFGQHDGKEIGQGRG
jgi:hypothetical protein